MRTYESPTDCAARIRQLCKAEGWNARHVTIRAERYSMGSSIHATIRSAIVKEKRLREILDTAEEIHRDEATGEILSGCNRFVHIYRTKELEAALMAPWLAPVADALSRLELEPSDNTHAKIEGSSCWIGWDGGQRGSGVRLWSEHAPRMAAYYSKREPGRLQGVQHLALHLALLIAAEADTTPAMPF